MWWRVNTMGSTMASTTADTARKIPTVHSRVLRKPILSAGDLASVNGETPTDRQGVPVRNVRSALCFQTSIPI